MRKLTSAVCVIVGGLLMIQSPLLARGGGGAHAGGGAFGGGGFGGGSVGNVGHVNNHPYYGYGGYSGYGYAMGPTTVEGDGALGGSSGGSAPTAYTGTGGGPPDQPQDGRGVNVSGGAVTTDGASWDSDWWAHDPHPGAGHAVGAVAGTTVASLPRGCDTVYLSSQPYYYNSGTFYLATDSGYDVVAAPIGISVRNVPDDADLISVNGQQYFQSGGAYYQALYSGDGLVYKVVEDPHASS